MSNNAGSTAGRSPADIRNIIFTGQTGAGKTTLAERLLFAAGAIQRIGKIEDGNTTSDYLDEERAHKHSLRPTVLHFEHEQHLVNMIDAPGLTDFIGHTIAAFPAVETVVVVIDAAKGIEPTTRRMMRVARQRRLPRMIIINKIDDDTADLQQLTRQIKEEFGAECLPINLPLKDRAGVADVFDHADGPETLFSSEAEAHQQIIEQIVEMQDDLMNTYLETGGDEALDPAAVHDAFEAALREAHLVPIAFCSAATGAGIDELLHVVAALLPSPEEGNPRPFILTREGEDTDYPPAPHADEPLLAHIFKVAADPFVGKLGVFRVHQGTLHARAEVLIGDMRKPVRVAHVYKRMGKDQVEVSSLGPGDIGAVAKIDEVACDAVIHDNHDLDGVHLRPLPMPEPVYGRAIELKNAADETKFATAIGKLLMEDPSLKLDRIAATKETVLRGLGELHLEVVQERLQHEYKIELLTRAPKVAYKETISATAEGHHRHKKQTGGAGQFGEVYLRVHPLPQDHDTGFEFVNATVGGSVPRQYMPAIEKGIKLAMNDGCFAGFPLSGVRVEVYDGKHHAVDSKEIAFVTAGKRAFIDAILKAKPKLLEPYVKVEATGPQDRMGDMSGLLSGKRGRVTDTVMLAGNMCTVVAEVPMSELGSFSSELKSLTGGAGSYTLEYSHDEPAPPHVQAEVVAAFEGHPVEA